MSGIQIRRLPPPSLEMLHTVKGNTDRAIRTTICTTGVEQVGVGVVEVEVVRTVNATPVGVKGTMLESAPMETRGVEVTLVAVLITATAVEIQVDEVTMSVISAKNQGIGRAIALSKGVQVPAEVARGEGLVEEATTPAVVIEGSIERKLLVLLR